MRRLMRDPKFVLLFAGQAINMFGDRALLVVLAIWVKELTGSDSLAGVTFVLLALPAVLAPLTGLLVDRFPRRATLIVNDLAAAVLVLCLLLVRDEGDLWIVYAVTLGYGVSNQIFNAARGGLVHSMVPKDLLGDANGLFSSLGQGLRIIGPLLGTAIFVAAGLGGVALLDAGTFVLSVVILLLLQSTPDLVRDRSRPSGRLASDLTAGVRHVLRDREMRNVIIAVGLSLGAGALINTAMFAAVEDGLGRPTAFIGVLAAFQGAGSIAGGVAVGTLIRRYGEARTAAIGFLLGAVGLALIIPTTEAGMCAGGVLVGISIPVFLVATTTLVQRRTEGELQGRALTAMEALIDLPYIAALAAGTVVIRFVPFRLIYAFSATAFLVLALYVLISRRGGTPERPEAAEGPGAEAAPSESPAS
ncbi:MFS transporter [Sphaerisporangium siamense]|uniref:MFS family permease n=1 Tax=Sphaerisporangium siamense TaxID=795645 RepID=A0A7W7D7J5_9ACTN|nr:MFS transporter [Sphaerisporangium siamense]MBB4701461.1 MFS family permease [Sphaerisporangium siamense]GII85584.1 MFS transporter [Sphaerisporangium siamense]